MTPEGKVKAEIKAYLTSIGAVYFMPVQTGYGGHALDLIVCWRGLYVEIETKALGNKPTARQLRRIKDVTAAGGLAFHCYDAQEVKDRFWRLDLERGYVARP